MDKKSLVSGTAAIVLTAGLALSPVVTDTDAIEHEVIEEVTTVEDEVSEEKEEDTEKVSEAEKIGTEEDITTESKQPHLEAEKPTYKDYTTEIGYSFTDESKRSKTLVIDVPDSLSADIATMYVNKAEVGTTLLPNQASFTTLPVVFEDLSNIEIKLYRMGEKIGNAYFIDGILKTNAKAVK